MNRIAQLRKQMKISQKDFGLVIGVAQNTVCNWEKGNREPDNESLRKMSEYFGVSVDYILGLSDDLTVHAPSPVPDRPAGIRIPVYGDTAAGIPIEAIEDYDSDDPDDWEEIPQDMARNGEYIALRIKGDSMEPRMKTGDVVIVRLQPDIETGDTAIVRVNGDSATCKKIKKTPEGILLISTNPEYEPMFYSKKDIRELPVTIIGKVVELRAKF